MRPLRLSFASLQGIDVCRDDPTASVFLLLSVLGIDVCGPAAAASTLSETAGFEHIGRLRGYRFCAEVQNPPSVTNSFISTNQVQTFASYSEGTIAAQDYFLQLPMARLLDVL